MAELRLHSSTRAELNEAEVNAIVNQICSKATFAQVTPFSYNDYPRLAGPGIETWTIFQAKPDGLIMDQSSLDAAPASGQEKGKGNNNQIFPLLEREKLVDILSNYGHEL